VRSGAGGLHAFMVFIPGMLNGVSQFRFFKFERLEKNGIFTVGIDFYQGMFRIIPESGCQRNLGGKVLLLNSGNQFVAIKVGHRDVRYDKEEGSPAQFPENLCGRAGGGHLPTVSFEVQFEKVEYVGLIVNDEYVSIFYLF